MALPIDYSDRIARVQVCLEILDHFEPAGQWRSHSLIKKWLNKSRYSMTVKEFKSLENLVERERQRVTAPKVDQLTLLGTSEPHAP